MSQRLIDAEKLKKHYAWWEDDERRTLFDQIVDAQPTIELIRCRDCKFFPTCLISKTMFLMGGDGYCANAEPKEEK